MESTDKENKWATTTGSFCHLETGTKHGVFHLRATSGKNFNYQGHLTNLMLSIHETVRLELRNEIFIFFCISWNKWVGLFHSIFNVQNIKK